MPLARPIPASPPASPNGPGPQAAPRSCVPAATAHPAGPASGLGSWAVPDAKGDLRATVVEAGPGAGTPIVFLHGLVGLNEHWDAVVEGVSDAARCLMFELPLLRLRGEHCSIQGVAALTAGFLRERLGTERGGRGQPAVLVGNSFGGHVALRIAIEHPELVRGLVLAGSSGLIEKSIVADVQIRPSREWLRRKIGELFYDRSLMREADLERAYVELSDRGGARAMVRLSRSARRDHLGDRIGTVRCPSLLIWGRQDIVTPPEAAEGFRRLLRGGGEDGEGNGDGAKLVWLDRCGHAPMMEKPAEFAAALRVFAREIGVLVERPGTIG